MVINPFAGKSMNLLAGQPGGSGNADGIGGDARFYGQYNELGRFMGLYGIAADRAGNLYVADYGNSTIRRIALSTGSVTTIAGVAGVHDNTDGVGTAARFSAPLGVAIDGADNLYVADSDNSTIRRIALGSGMVTTIAGTARSTGSADGTGAAARFYQPQGLALDGAGNLYVADKGNSTIRKIVLATGMVSTLAGTAGIVGSFDGSGTAALFNGPAGVAADGAGNLYVADSSNHTVRRIALATGMVTTIAGSAGNAGGSDGTGTDARFRQLQALFPDGAGNLYIADSGNYTLRKLVLATGAVSTIAGSLGSTGTVDGTGSTARFSAPQGLALDGAGNLYVADPQSCTVRKIELATAAVSTLAGTPGAFGRIDGPNTQARFDDLTGVTLDSGHDLYVAETYFSNGAIRKIDHATGTVSTVANGGSFAPRGVAADGRGNVYVSNNNVIYKLELATGTMSTLAGSLGDFRGVDGIGTAASFHQPHGLALDGAGNLYVADIAEHTIRQIILATRTVLTLAGAGGQSGGSDGAYDVARFAAPSGLASDGAGNLYVAESGNHTIRKIALASHLVTTVAGTALQRGSTDGTGSAARFDGPSSLTYDGAGHLFIADTNNAVIRQLDLPSGIVTTVIGVVGQRGVKTRLVPAGLNKPTGITWSATDGLIIVDSAEHAVLAVR